VEEKVVDDLVDNNEDILDKKTTKKSEKVKKKDQLEIERLKEENRSLKEEYLKSLAELENFKKRMNEERVKDRKYAASNLIGELLLPLDQLKKVVEMSVDDETLKNFLIGFKMINDKIYQVLEDDGLKEIDALNKEFDPNFHYAVEKISDKDKPNSVVVEVTSIGYMYKDRILRPAMVKVNEWSEENE